MTAIEIELRMRLQNAAEHRCRLTARARVRDIAELYGGRDTKEYEDKYNELTTEYNIK